MFKDIFEKIICIIAFIYAGVAVLIFSISVILHPECFKQEIQPVYVYEDFDGNIGQTDYCYQNRCNIGDKYTSVKWTYKVNIKYNEPR